MGNHGRSGRGAERAGLEARACRDIGIDSGGWRAVGFPGGHFSQGIAYIFTEPPGPGGWETTSAPAAVLNDPGGARGDLFGTSVAVDGDTVVVGALEERAAYVYTMPGGGWSGPATPAATLQPAGTPLITSVAVAGSTVAAGTSAVTVGGHLNQGAVYLWDEPGGWSGTHAPTAELTDVNEAAGAALGTSVAMNATTVAAGAPRMAGGGAVDVFAQPAGGWAAWSAATDPPAELTDSSGSNGDLLGVTVAMSGDTIVAGAQAASSHLGRTDIFAQPPGGWATTGTPAASFPDPTGTAGDASGAAGGGAVVSAAIEAAGKGAVYVYGVPAPPPLPQLGLADVLVPHHQVRVRVGSVLRVAAVVAYPGGMVISPAVAAMLSAACDVTIRAAGALSLPRRCMGWDSTRHQFSYRWHLEPGITGKATIQVRLAYRSV